MKTVFKYMIDNTGIVTLPIGAEVLSTGIQEQRKTFNDFLIWALIDTEVTDTEERKFVIHGTGWDCGTSPLKFIGTVFEKKFVWHVFEVLK